MQRRRVGCLDSGHQLLQRSVRCIDDRVGTLHVIAQRELFCILLAALRAGLQVRLDPQALLLRQTAVHQPRQQFGTFAMQFAVTIVLHGRLLRLRIGQSGQGQLQFAARMEHPRLHRVDGAIHDGSDLLAGMA